MSEPAYSPAWAPFPPRLTIKSTETMREKSPTTSTAPPTNPSIVTAPAEGDSDRETRLCRNCRKPVGPAFQFVESVEEHHAAGDDAKSHGSRPAKRPRDRATVRMFSIPSLEHLLASG